MTTRLNRRALLAGALSLPWVSATQAARSVVDSAGRTVSLPDRMSRVMAAGPPAAAVVYCLAPEQLIGWQRAPRAEEKPYLLAHTHDLPELGRLTGRSDTANVEVVLQAKPDVIVDFGSVTPTYVSLATATQERTGAPYLLIDGRFEATPASLRLLGSALGVSGRADRLAVYAETVFKVIDAALAPIEEGQRPRVYLARGAKGLETGLRGSINTEILERAGGRNVADGGGQRRGVANVSPEQLLVWDPEVVVTWDRAFFERVTRNPEGVWPSISAVRNKRIHLAPTAPFGWIDGPPSVNRLIGLQWLANMFHGARIPFDFATDTRTFYKLFYQVDVADADLARLIAWADGKPPASQPR